MNKMIWRSFLCFALCALTFSLASCGDDDNPNNPENVTPANQNTDNGSQATASIVGNWGIVGDDNDYIFFNADGTGGFMEYGSTGYHQDGAFRWVRNADGSYSFSGTGLHDGVQYMAMESYDGNTMVVNIQFEGDDKVEHLILRRMSSKPSTPTPAIVDGKKIDGMWFIQDSNDYISFNSDGTGSYMEFGSTGYHQDAAFNWAKNADGTYSFSGAGLPDGVHYMAIESYDGNDNMVVKIQFEKDDNIERLVLMRAAV